MLEELKASGLTENEAKVYLALSESDEATATPLRRRTSLHLSRVYEALASLMEKGLVSYFMRNNIKHFKSQPPEVLLQTLDEKKRQLALVIPQIQLLKSKVSSPYAVSVHEGYKAFRQLYDHLLAHLDTKSEILVLGAQEESVHFVGSTFFKHYTARRIKQKIRARMIFNADALDTAKKHNQLALTKARVLPLSMIVPATMDIFPDKIAFLLLREKPLVFLIECKEITDSYASYFHFLWKSAKEC